MIRRAQSAPSHEAFRALLAALDSDRERAAKRYEELREKLVIFFCGRSCPDPEGQADETLDRLAHRLQEGQIADPARFAYGIARFVWLEWTKRDRRRRRALREVASTAQAFIDPSDDEIGKECIRRCADRLNPADRDLIIAYYGSEGGAAVSQDRRAVAERFGLTSTALRVRAFRIRRELGACARQCMAGRPVPLPRRTARR
jgi:DNA-directed RNA polymerase specialized sigma24 family protein